MHASSLQVTILSWNNLDVFIIKYTVTSIHIQANHVYDTGQVLGYVDEEPCTFPVFCLSTAQTHCSILKHMCSQPFQQNHNPHIWEDSVQTSALDAKDTSDRDCVTYGVVRFSRLSASAVFPASVTVFPLEVVLMGCAHDTVTREPSRAPSPRKVSTTMGIVIAVIIFI